MKKIIIAIIALFLTVATTNAQTATATKALSLSEVLTKASSLPSSLQMPIIQAVAAGDSAKANVELKKAEEANAKAQAQSQVAKTKAAAMAKLEAQWNKEVSPLCTTQSIKWADSKTKAQWLSDRWISRGLISTPIDTTKTLEEIKKDFAAGVDLNKALKAAVDARVKAYAAQFKDSRVDGLLTRLTAVEGLATQANTRLDAQWAHIEAHTARLDTAEARLDSTETRLTGIEARLSATEINALAALKGLDFAKIKDKARKDAEEFRAARLAEAAAELNPVDKAIEVPEEGVGD